MRNYQRRMKWRSRMRLQDRKSICRNRMRQVFVNLQSIGDRWGRPYDGFVVWIEVNWQKVILDLWRFWLCFPWWCRWSRCGSWPWGGWSRWGKTRDRTWRCWKWDSWSLADWRYCNGYRWVVQRRRNWREVPGPVCRLRYEEETLVLGIGLWMVYPFVKSSVSYWFQQI